MLETLEKYHREGLLYKQVHPSLPLTIWNYTEKVQYEGLWDDITLMSRGLVTDYKGNVVARPFKKFFNLEEGKHASTSDFDVYEKMDGSLGIFFYYEGGWVMATRGSFTSDQAVKGYEMMFNYDFASLHNDYTYLFEIIYPENRIVVDYGYDELIMLAVIDNKDGYELRIHDNDIHLEGIRLVNLYNNLGFKIVKKYDGIEDYKQLKSMIGNNAEGFVIKFKSGFRMKIKGEDYVRLHRLLTSFSNVDIWELLKDGKDLNGFLDRVPDEFDKWVKKTIRNLQYHKYAIGERAGKIYDYFRYGKYGDRETEPTKKEFAGHLEFCGVEPSIRSICFAMWDGKDYDQIIWKMIRPKYQKPFWNKEEEILADSKWIKKD